MCRDFVVCWNLMLESFHRNNETQRKHIMLTIVATAVILAPVVALAAFILVFGYIMVAM